MKNVIEVMKSEVESLTKVTSKLEKQSSQSMIGFSNEEETNTMTIKLRNFYVQIA
jgi:hypothetical protein